MTETADRAQLNEYFAAELNALRTRAREFAHENPSIAEELMLNKNNEGKSRDPHVEMLIQSFAWLTSRLRQNMESEAAKLPSMLLQQLYPQLTSSIPSMAIAQFDVQGFKANFDNGYVLDARKPLEPLGVDPQQRHADKLQQCRLTTCFETTLWPVKVTKVRQRAVNDLRSVTQHFAQAQSVINLSLAECEEGAGKNTRFSQPLRFYMNLDESQRFVCYDFMHRHLVGATVVLAGQDERQKPLAVLNRKDITFCGFADHERLFPLKSHQDLGFSLLQDYFVFPEKFMFFELNALANVSAKQPLEVRLIFDESAPAKLRLSNEAFKLNCVPVINLFQKTTEPLPLHYKDYRYRLYPNRQHYDSFEIVQINKVYSVNKQGETRKLSPYFSFEEHPDAPYRWMVQQEVSHRKQLAGSETWISLFDTHFDSTSAIGETLYAETWSCNRSVCELFNKSQSFGVIGSAPVKSVQLLTRPSRHRASNTDQARLWELLSHLSLYYVSLTDPTLAKDMLTRMLSLYAHKDNPINLRQVEGIEKLEVEDDVQPHLEQSWRGYYRGSKFTLTLTERKLDGCSPMLLGCVIHHFLALFCHINSFVRLELKLGNRSIYQWQPQSGHQMLI